MNPRISGAVAILGFIEPAVEMIDGRMRSDPVHRLGVPSIATLQLVVSRTHVRNLFEYHEEYLTVSVCTLDPVRLY